MNKIYYYIYETTNLINGKTYIGQHTTENLDDGYMGSGQALKSAFLKYGLENFKKEILMFAVNEVALNFMEQCLVTVDFINDTSNYNLKEGGGSHGRWSQDVKSRLSKAHTGKIVSPETRLRMSLGMKGRVRSAEHQEKLRLSQVGRKFSEETKKKMSDAKKGRKLSPEHSKKISEAAKGRIRTPEHQAKLNKCHTGKKRSESTRLKMSIAKLGTKITPETRAKMSAVHKELYNANPNHTFKHCQKSFCI